MDIKDCKILICDDSILARKQLKDVLTSAGCCNFLEARDGQAAIDIYKAEKPTLVFLDIVMPNVDGIEAVKQIMAFDKDAVIIMVSSVGTQNQIKASLLEGAKDFIQKPFVATQITNVLKKRVEGI
ncbi:MAG: response regulator [Lachnospiraceae bacterium]|jgi:two-component system chemotaxis response regulator CheY|nr:response regulator [Lachnospiraceae bacterium]